MENNSSIGIADYGVCFVTLILSAAIGVYYRFTGGRQKTTKEYLWADRNQSIIPVAISIMASFMSSITLIGVPAEFYAHGTQFVIIDLGYVVLAPLAAYLYLPVFFKLQTTSTYEYLSRRFGHAARLIASLVYSIQMVLYMGVVLYAPSIVIHALTKLSQEWSILVTGVVCTFYSTLGGMKAIIVTDIFQSLLMYASVFIVVATAAAELGGLTQIWEIAKERGRVEFFNLSFDPTVRHTFWGLLCGGGFQFLSLYAVNQTQVQRYLSMKDLKTAVWALYISVPILCVLSVTTAFAGLSIFAIYKDCDPVAAGRIPSSDQILPLYIMDTVGSIPGLTGLFVAGVFSAALSTVSALLNALAAVTLEDYIKPIYLHCTNKPLDSVVFTTKLLSLLYGIICIAVAYSAKYLGSILQATITIFGAVGGPLLGIFTLGMFVPIANEVGAIVGTVTGLIVALWLGFGGPKPPVARLPVSTAGCLPQTNTTTLTTIVTNVTSVGTSTSLLSTTPISITDNNHYFYLFRLSYLWYIVIGFTITMVIGTLVSMAYALGTARVPISTLDPDLFSPPIAAYLRKRKCVHSVDTNNGVINLNIRNIDQQETKKT